MTIARIFGALIVGASLGAVSGTLSGCGAGPDGATINISNSQNQTNDQTQVQNESELDCTVSCAVGTGGFITGTKECSGGAVSVVIVQSLDECDSVNEVVENQATATGEVQG